MEIQREILIAIFSTTDWRKKIVNSLEEEKTEELPKIEIKNYSCTVDGGTNENTIIIRGKTLEECKKTLEETNHE